GAAFEAMTAAATRWEWPQRFLSDNAKAYKHTLAAAVGALGVDHRHGRSYHPQTHGKVERFHQTLQRSLRAQPVAATLDQLQTQLDTFVDIYNNQRPHQAVGRRTPAAVYADTPKTGPADKPFGTPTPTQSQDVRDTTLRIPCPGTLGCRRRYAKSGTQCAEPTPFGQRVADSCKSRNIY